MRSLSLAEPLQSPFGRPGDPVVTSWAPHADSQGPAAPSDTVFPSSDQDRDQALNDLMPAVRDGSEAAFQRLYALTSPLLFGIVLRINAVRPEAEEVLQEIYIKVWTERASFDDSKGKLMFWLTAIARYGAIDSVRRRHARPAFKSAPVGTDSAEPADCYAGFVSPVPGPLEHIILKQGASAVLDMLGGLPQAQRQSLVLAFYEGLSCSEIAHRLNKPLGTVKSSLRRSLQKMRPALAAHR